MPRAATLPPWGNPAFSHRISENSSAHSARLHGSSIVCNSQVATWTKSCISDNRQPATCDGEGRFFRAPAGSSCTAAGKNLVTVVVTARAGILCAFLRRFAAP